MSMSDRETYLEQNPHIKQVIKSINNKIHIKQLINKINIVSGTE